MWPLLLCSVTSLTVILERLYFWTRLNLDKNKGAIESLLEACRTGGTSDALERKNEGAVYSMLLSGIAHAEYSSTKAMEAVALEEIKAMRRGMPILDTVITIAPMLGILGTVTGIISSFEMLGQTGVDDPKSVVSGIAEALITTATGLGISLATIFPFNYFNSRIEDAQDVFDHYGTRLEIVLDTPPSSERK